MHSGHQFGRRSFAEPSPSTTTPPKTTVSSTGNCKICSNLRALGHTIDRCNHQGVSSVQSSDQLCLCTQPTRLRVQTKLKKKQKMRPSISQVDLQEQELQARQMESLFISAAKGDHENIEWLMLSGVDVWQRDSESRTILHIAAAHGRTRVVEFLVSQSGDMNCQDLWGYTPLDCALNNGHFSVAEYLVTHGAKKLNLSSGSELSANLCSLAALGQLDELKQLAAKGADMSLSDYDRRSPLHLAASEGHACVCKYLVEEAGVPVNSIDRFGITPLQGALDNHHSEIAAYLQAHGGIMSDRHSNILLYTLMTACASGDIASVKKMVENDAVNVNLTNYDGRSPLHLAAANGNAEIVSFLLLHGAKTDILDRWGSDAYHEAAKHNFRKVIDILDPENRNSITHTYPLDVIDEDVDTGTISECCRRFGHRRDIVHEALQLALEEACAASGSVYGEVWTPNRHRVALQCCRRVAYYAPSANQQLRSQLQHFNACNHELLIDASLFFGGAPIRTGKLAWLEDLSSVNQSVYFCCPMARVAGLQSVFVVPVRDKGSSQHSFAFAILMSNGKRAKSEEDLESATRTFAVMSSLLLASVLLQDDEVSRVGYVETIQKLLQQFDSSDSNTASENQLRFFIRLLLNLKIVDQFLEWGESMLSEDHKAAMVLLLWLVKHVHKCESVADRLISLFRYLYTVSPLMESESPVRAQANKALDDLREAGYDPGKLPFFGHGLPRSPVFSHIKMLREHLVKSYENYEAGKNVFESGAFRPVDMQSLILSPGEVFDACGSHNVNSPMTPRQMAGFYFGPTAPVPEANEADRVSELGTKMLRTLAPNELVTSESLLELHRCLTLDSGTSSGEFRSGLAVGSHMFYKFYRVFAPADEVPELIHVFEKELCSMAGRMPPVMHAYFVFAVIVCYIHPFEDGNGRIGRVLGNMILKSHGYPPIFRSNHKVISFEEFMSLVTQERTEMS